MTDGNARASESWCPKCGGAHSPMDPCHTSGTRTGTVLEGKYALTRLLGEGGMGEVYEARHLKIGRRAAVKFLHGQFAKSPEVAQRFENEARAAGEVQHENIAAVFDVGALPDGTQYLVMELLEGEDLDHLLKREGRLSLTRAADIVTQACQGLDVVHRRGIVHRDLKPANLFLTKRANGADLVKILDFGIAKLRRPEGDASATGTGVALGTPYYMSPEQARGDREIGTRSDVYTLGVIFYELLSGRRPHDGESLLQILHHILTQPPRPLEEVRPDLPREIYALVRKAMALNGADRFTGVNELAVALEPFTKGTYRASQPAPLEATRLETSGGVRVGTAQISSAGALVQSVAGLPPSGVPTRRWVRSMALAASAIAVLALGVEAVLWTHGRGGAPVAMPTASASASALVATAAPSVPSAAPPANTAVLPPAASASAERVSGQGAASGHSEDPAAPLDPRGNHGPGPGPALAPHGGGPASTAKAPPRVSGKGSSGVPAAPAAATKPDCTQTYTIDSEGNKHFRPECFTK